MARVNATVTIPFAGSVHVWLDDVDAGLTDDELYDLALDRFDGKFASGDNCEIQEVELHRKLLTGNVMHFWCNEFSVEREAAEDDDEPLSGPPDEDDHDRVSGLHPNQRRRQ